MRKTGHVYNQEWSVAFDTASGRVLSADHICSNGQPPIPAVHKGNAWRCPNCGAEHEATLELHFVGGRQ